MTARLDPELKEPLQKFLEAVGGALVLDNIPAMRGGMQQNAIALNSRLPPVPGVSIEDRHIPGPAGAPELYDRYLRVTWKFGTIEPCRTVLASKPPARRTRSRCGCTPPSTTA